jgi:ADP-ribose pyrophosphatase YjhB (NUDIX family)
MSLNPALEEARFCPRCGAAATVDFPRRIACDTCGYQAYFNPKPVAAAIPFDGAGRIWLHRRGYEPGKGLWTFVGGFVDLGESIEEAARREAREEMDLDLDLGPLVGVYSRPQERVVLIVYRARINDGSTPKTTDEATEIAGFAPGELPWDEMAFWSTEQALRDVLRDAG